MSQFEDFEDIELSQVVDLAKEQKARGMRCLQVCCTTTDDGIDVMYSYRAVNGFDGVHNYAVHGLSKGDAVPSIQDVYPGVFPFENEAHDLFGLEVRGMEVDFGGKFYRLGEEAPMSVVSPEQIARKEKAAKIARALEAKKARAARKAEEAKAAAPQGEEGGATAKGGSAAMKASDAASGKGANDVAQASASEGPKPKGDE